MKLKDGRITFLVSRERITISLIDNEASTTFAEVLLTPEQFAQALGRTSHTECEISVYGLDKIGKTHENDSFEFEIDEELTKFKRDNKYEELNDVCIKALSEAGKSDWTPDRYYASQNSFFKKDGKQYARVTIRRWI